MVSIYTETLFITTYLLGMTWLLMSLAVVLVRKRRTNLPHYYTPILGVNFNRRNMPNVPSQSPRVMSYIPQTYQEMPMPKPIEPETSENGYLEHLPADWKHRANGSVGEQLTIHIEPDGTLSDDQRNIQRIISYLQKMPGKLKN